MRRLFWLAIGWLCVALAIAGVILPLVPTVVFLIGAAFAFSRSSPRFHAWLTNHPVLGPPLRNWQEHGAIPLRAKLLAVPMIAGSFALTWLLGAPAPVLIGLALLLSAVVVFIVTRPNA